MAWQAHTDESVAFRTMGATVLVASNTIVTSTQTTAVFVGRGAFEVEILVTALSTGTAFDIVIFYVERNTAAATTTWQQIGALPIGDATGVGLSAQGVDDYHFAVMNTGDYQTRLNVQVLGSAASVTYSANVYPLRTKEAI
jgi:hypothetical protein